MPATLTRLAAMPFLAAAPDPNVGEATPAGIVPNPTPTPIPGMDVIASDFLGWLKWAGVIAGVAGLIVCGIMMIAGRRNRSSFAADGATGIAWVIGGLAVISFGAGLVGFVFTAQ